MGARGGGVDWRGFGGGCRWREWVGVLGQALVVGVVEMQAARQDRSRRNLKSTAAQVAAHSDLTHHITTTPTRMQSPSHSSSRTPSISIATPITTHPPFPFPNPSTPISSSSSPQHSLDILRNNSSAPKRARHALRQFYNLSATTGEPLPSLDRDDFSAESYIANLLSEKSLRDLLTLENTLINDIRGLDGERKALVYDNYSKLIAATDTIRRMRASMEPLTPTTSTLEPAVSHIEGVSRGLVEGMRAASPRPSAARGKLKGVETVKWALAAPERIRGLMEEGRKDEAEKVLVRLRELCDKWEGAAGVDALRKKGEGAFGKEQEHREDIS